MSMRSSKILIKSKKKFYIDRDRTRTCNPQIRSLMPYPLGHTAAGYKRTTNEAYSCFTIFIVYTHLFHEFPFLQRCMANEITETTVLPSTTLPKQWARYAKRTYVYAFCKHWGWLIVVEWKKIYVWHLNSWKASRVEENWRNQFLTTENGWFLMQNASS